MGSEITEIEAFANNVSRLLKKGDRFLIRNLKHVIRVVKKDVVRTKIIPSSTLANTDNEYFQGVKKSYNESPPPVLFKYMSSKYAISAI